MAGVVQSELKDFVLQNMVALDWGEYQGMIDLNTTQLMTLEILAREAWKEKMREDTA